MYIIRFKPVSQYAQTTVIKDEETAVACFNAKYKYKDLYDYIVLEELLGWGGNKTIIKSYYKEEDENNEIC